MGIRLSIVVSLFAVDFAHAAALDVSKTQEAVFRKCYAFLTGEVPAANDATLASVKAGTITAENACLAILDKGKLSPNLPTGSQYGYDPTGLKVLKSLNDFHRSWFVNDSFASYSSAEQYVSTSHSLYDSTEPALHFTRALLAGLSVDTVLTSTTGMRANRTTAAALSVNGSGVPNYAVTGTGAHLFRMGTGYDDQAPWYPTPLVEVGRLVGISPGVPQVLIPNFHGYGYENTAADWPQTGINALANRGGGILGIPAYMYLNWGQGHRIRLDGGHAVARRYAQTVFEDLLCRSLPVVRPADVQIQQSSTLAFRQSPKCMQCHISMDSAAHVARNHKIAYTSLGYDAATRPVFLMNKANVTKVADPSYSGADWKSVAWLDNDVDYFRRPPTGRFYFRSYDGTLHDKPIEGLAGFAAAIRATPDFYACVAKRYFQRMTGISADLSDPGDPASPALSPVEKGHRDFVISLGTALQTDKSMRLLIKRIVSSQYFLQPAAGKP